jgi:hypothetical protein
MAGLRWRGRRGLEGASEGAGGSQRERVPSALPSGGGSQRWHGTGAAAPSAGGAGTSAQGRIGGRVALVVGGGWEGGAAPVVGRGWNRYVCGSREKKNDRERIKNFPLCVLISRKCVFTAIGLATNHWSL